MSKRYPLYQKIGCVGCLIYMVLFSTAAALVTSYKLDTLWAIPILAGFVLIWFLVIVWAMPKK
jgi:hypothetical protein